MALCYFTSNKFLLSAIFSQCGSPKVRNKNLLHHLKKSVDNNGRSVPQQVDQLAFELTGVWWLDFTRKLLLCCCMNLKDRVWLLKSLMDFHNKISHMLTSRVRCKVKWTSCFLLWSCSFPVAHKTHTIHCGLGEVVQTLNNASLLEQLGVKTQCEISEKK